MDKKAKRKLNFTSGGCNEVDSEDETQDNTSKNSVREFFASNVETKKTMYAVILFLFRSF